MVALFVLTKPLTMVPVEAILLAAARWVDMACVVVMAVFRRLVCLKWHTAIPSRAIPWLRIPSCTLLNSSTVVADTRPSRP